MEADSRKLKIENLPIKNFKLIVEWRRRRRIMDKNKKKTLIVVDMQNDFIDGALGTKEAVAIVENVKIR